MWELRNTIFELMGALGMTQADVVRALRAQNRFYPVYESELSRYLSGESKSPKAHRVLEDAMKLLTRELEKRNQEQIRAKNALRQAGK